MIEIRENFDLKAYNTFGISASCKYFVACDDEKELLDFVTDYALVAEEVLILGGGSNFLFTADFPGVVFYPMMKGINIVSENEQKVLVRVGSGEKWDDFVCWSVEHGYGGIENLSMIPGHVGATPVQNIGAYGVEVGNVIRVVEAVELETGRLVEIKGEGCHFGYRDSIFKQAWKNRYIVTQVIFELEKQPRFNLSYGLVKEEIERLGEVSLKHIRAAIMGIREKKLPDVDVLPNAGSFFKNPIIPREELVVLQGKYPEIPVYPVDNTCVKIAAAWLIERAGWKGKGIGKAAVHEKQALVLINRGGASGLEVARLANEIKKSVFLLFGIWLEPEVNII